MRLKIKQAADLGPIFKYKTLKVFRTTRLYLFPRLHVSFQSEYFAGGLSGEWLYWSFEYNHMSRAWKAQKHS